MSWNETAKDRFARPQDRFESDLTCVDAAATRTLPYNSKGWVKRFRATGLFDTACLFCWLALRGANRIHIG